MFLSSPAQSAIMEQTGKINSGIILKMFTNWIPRSLQNMELVSLNFLPFFFGVIIIPFHLTGYVLPFTCCVCKRACKNADSLERHMKFHSEKDAPNFPQQLSSTNSQRRRHLIDLHAVDPSNLADNRAGHLLQC